MKKEYWIVDIERVNFPKNDLYPIKYYHIFLGRFDSKRIAEYMLKEFIQAYQRGNIKNKDMICDYSIICSSNIDNDIIKLRKKI